MPLSGKEPAAEILIPQSGRRNPGTLFRAKQKFAGGVEESYVAKPEDAGLESRRRLRRSSTENVRRTLSSLVPR